MRTPSDWPTSDPLAHRVRATPEATAVVDADSGREVTYRALDAQASRAADRLRSRVTESAGGETRPRLAIPASTDLPFVVGLFAVWRLGGLAVPVDADVPPPRLAERLDRAGVDAVVDPNADRAGSAPAVDAVETIPLDGTVDATPTGRGAPRDHGPGPDPAAWPPDETVLVLFTSGTTGEPKGVRLTGRNLLASATASAFRLGVTRDDRWLCCLPTNHMGGLAPIVRSTLYGTATVLQGAFDAGETARAMAAHDSTGVSLVPTMLERLLDAGWEPPESLRFVLLGGAPASEDLIERCGERAVPVHPTYGTTETASQIATATPDGVRSNPGTVGQPLAFADVEVLDHDGRPCQPGTVGEIHVDGPMVSPGYLDAEATEAAFGDHGLRTGDLAVRDDDGRLWIEGRVDDAIQTGGETVHPARVAETLRADPAVADAAVVGLADEEWGERVAALVVPSGDALDVTGLLERCRTDLAPYEVPKVVETAPELPRSQSGTVNRAAARDAFEE